MYFIVRFPVKQTRGPVLRGESLEVMEFVLKNSFVKVAAEPDVERA